MIDSEGGGQTDSRSPPSHKVIAEIARRTDVAPTELPPLHDVINPDALDTLFQPTPNAGRMDGTISFEYSGYEITVHADGFVDVTSLDQ